MKALTIIFLTTFVLGAIPLAVAPPHQAGWFIAGIITMSLSALGLVGLAVLSGGGG